MSEEDLRTPRGEVQRALRTLRRGAPQGRGAPTGDCTLIHSAERAVRLRACALLGPAPLAVLSTAPIRPCGLC